MDYTEISDDQRREMLTIRLARYEGQHYDATVNRAMLEACEKPTAEADEMIARMEVCAAATRRLIAAIGVGKTG